MTVFKGYLRIIKSNLGYILMYFGIFLAITIMMESIIGKSGGQAFEATKMNLGIVCETDSEAGNILVEYLKERQNVEMLEHDKSILQEKLFTRSVDIILMIPKDFETHCLEEGKPLEVTVVPGSFANVYLEQQVNNFLNAMRVYYDSGYSPAEAAKAAAENAEVKAEVTLNDKTGHGGKVANYTYFYRYLPYLSIAVLCYVMSIVLVSFRKRDISRRMKVSAIPAIKQNLLQMLAFIVTGIGFGVIIIVICLTLYGTEIFTDSWAGYFWTNNAMMILNSLAMAFVIGMLIQRTMIASNVSTVLSLGMAFICGVFVDQDMLAEGVRKVAQFLPVYWFEKANNLMANNAVVSAEMQQEVWQALGIQLLFAAACVCVALAVAKFKEREKE